MYGCVYKITCLINNKVWVGATKGSSHSRWIGHKSEARCERFPNHPFYDDIRKYGQAVFRVEVIRYRATKKQNLESEHYYIRKLNTLAPNGYNMRLGCRSTPELSERMSKDIKRGLRALTPEQRSECAHKVWTSRRSRYSPEERWKQHSAGAKKAWKTTQSRYTREQISNWNRRSTR